MREFQVNFTREGATLAVSVVFQDDFIIALAKSQESVKDIPAKWFEGAGVDLEYLY